MLVTRRFISIVCVLLSLFFLTWPAMAQERTGWDKQFQTQIHEWIDAIAGRDPQFTQWQKAQTEVQTLGANQHQWLVSIKNAGRQVGYLVVGEAQDPNQKAKFVLLEYGVGEYILFDDAFAPRQIGAEPVYDGFASHWLVAQNQWSQMINAKTGETYPADIQASEPVMSLLSEEELAHDGQRLTQAHLLKQTEQDPFDQISWVNDLSSGSNVTWAQLWQEKPNSRITLTVPLHQSQVLAPFVVGSLHLWNDQSAYVGVWDEGLRFVPYAYAHKIGSFHLTKTSSPSE